MRVKLAKIEEKIKEIVADYLHKPAKSLKSTDTMETLGGDSLDFVEIILAIEEEFQFLIPAEDADQFKNLGDLINYVKANKK